MSAVVARGMHQVRSDVSLLTSSLEEDRQNHNNDNKSSSQSMSSFQPGPAKRPFSRRTGKGIDYEKYKTKFCRFYLNGVECPFRARCAFLHGTEVSAEGSTDASPEKMKEDLSSPSSAADQKDFSISMESMSITMDELDPNEEANDVEVYADEETTLNFMDDQVSQLPPPSYAAAVQDMADCSVPQDAPPPPYPVRFRYNPYCLVSAVIYECA